MYHDLNKADKKIARIALDKGLEVTYSKGLEKAEAVIAAWRSGNLNNKDAYLKLYATVDKHNGELSKRYDGLSGSKYLITVAALLNDGYITEDDINDFSDEAKEMVKRWIAAWSM